LFGLFHQQGFAHIVVYPRPVAINSFEVFNTVLPFAAAAHTAAEKGVVDLAAVETLLADLQRRDAAGRFFGCIVGFIALGRKA